MVMMSARHPRKPAARVHWIHSTRLHLVMYSMLLVATPFLMLRNFLQPNIARLSRFSFGIAGTDVPIILVVAAVLLIGGLILFRAHLTRLRILAGVIVVAMNAMAQQITDYYFDHEFYDLQQNWHYFAYATFAIMAYRDLAPRGIRPARIMLITFLLGVSFSTFDEAFQLGMSGRIFDMGDIAKDAWGTLMGIALLYVGGTEPKDLRDHRKQLRQPTWRGYFQNPLSLLVLLVVLGLLFLCFASLLEDRAYWLLIVLLTIGSFAVIFLLFHLSQRKPVRYAALAILLAAVLTQSYYFVRYRAEQIVHNRFGLTVYKGIPIPFFDVMIFPNGAFRPVAKKHFFSLRDQRFFLKQQTDIILIGSGAEGLGGRGFPQDVVSQFLYNPYTQRGTQVIILETPKACELFNRLKREQKSVLFILHNTC
jgi:hypothetical protein